MGIAPRLMPRDCNGSMSIRVVLPLIVLFSGCANTCFTAISNQGNATVSVVASSPPPTCALSKARGTLQVVVHGARVCEACSESNRVQNIFVTLKGIQLHLKTNLGEEPRDWEEIFPQLEKHPRQVDLMKTSVNGLARESAGEPSTIPAGTYDQVRLLFVLNQTGLEGQLPTENVCGATGSNCVIKADGRVQALLFDNDALELRISSETLADGFIFIPPDREGTLLIGLTPIWSAVPSFRGVQFQPVLAGNAKFERQPAANEKVGAEENVHAPQR
jgi:Domain of unknown function (DUF4382)